MNHKIALIIYRAYQKEAVESRHNGHMNEAIALQHHASAWLTVAEELQVLAHAGTPA